MKISLHFLSFVLCLKFYSQIFFNQPSFLFIFNHIHHVSIAMLYSVLFYTNILFIVLFLKFKSCLFRLSDSIKKIKIARSTSLIIGQNIWQYWLQSFARGRKQSNCEKNESIKKERNIKICLSITIEMIPLKLVLLLNDLNSSFLNQLPATEFRLDQMMWWKCENSSCCISVTVTVRVWKAYRRYSL